MSEQVSAEIEMGGEANERVQAFATSRRRASVLIWLAQISRFALAALFLLAVVAKLYFINDREHSFLKMMPNLVGERWALPVVIAVFMAESASVVLLLWRRTVRIGALWAAFLLVSFAVYALYYRYGLGNSEGLECGCFGGIIASQLGVTTALRNLLLLIPCALTFFGLSAAHKKVYAANETDQASPAA